MLKPLHNKLLPFQDIHLDKWTSAEKEGGWGPGVGECEVEFEWGQLEIIKDMCENGVGICLSPSVVLGERESGDWVRRMGAFAALCLTNSAFYTMKVL